MQKLRTYLAIVSLLMLFSSCLSERLTAHMDYLSKKSLASYHVGTPDPYLNTPPIGQRILISWHVRKNEFYASQNYALKLTLRFCNHTEKVQWIKLCKNRGTCIYKLINQEYFECSGIQTYKVELFKGDHMIECWRHQLWAELILLNS